MKGVKTKEKKGPILPPKNNTGRQQDTSNTHTHTHTSNKNITTKKKIDKKLKEKTYPTNDKTKRTATIKQKKKDTCKSRLL